jgi:hypothetical protein
MGGYAVKEGAELWDAEEKKKNLRQIINSELKDRI